MKKIAFIFFPFLLTGFIYQGENKSLYYDGLLLQIDGPYVLYRNNQIFVKYVYDSSGVDIARTDSFPLLQKDDIVLHAATDEAGKIFFFHLNPKLAKERSDFKKANKLFVLSDIEGNFFAFRNLLQANGVIDENFNWIFGDGNLVLTGDFFDRGSQVTEVLWLIYSLEQKAKAAGGYVHFVLGNHEIMNMSNDLRYIHPKYLQTVTSLKEQYTSLYDENSEIGRWLRTKNIMEKIGDLLFTHGGISPEINRMDASITDINELARPFYSNTTYRYPDPRIDIIYGESGPFWYRGYYMGKRIATPEQIDSTLTKFYVRHIFTGHTIIADTVSMWYDEKLFDTDVHHAGGKSEALLIEDKKFYRVNPKGQKILILEK
ncbi:MAG TPA: metallophosphoesterase [Chitinophagaceae bacterium]|nr:metallophosphoesterase [Chitinophagaceae bacterium]